MKKKQKKELPSLREVFGNMIDEGMKSPTYGNIGCRGRRIKVVPEKSGILGQEDITHIGKVIAVGPEAHCKVGDRIIFNNDGMDRTEMEPGVFVYHILDIDEFVFEIL